MLASLWAALGGSFIFVAGIKTILYWISIDAEKDKKVVLELAGRDLESLIAKGSTRLASMPASGGGGVAAPAAAANEEAKEEESEESDYDIGFGLFD